MASSGNIKQITLPNGNTYDINAVTVNGHTVETDVPSGAVFTDTKYTAATANPKMDGTVAVGTSTKYAREDHVHPSDTSRVPTTRKVNNKALSAAITLAASDVGAFATSAKGAASGVAELDANGKVPSSQLPSFVDDVLEYNGTSSFPSTGEAGKIYVDTSTNKTYRWGGSSYTEISASLALGETSSTAYRGDRGKTAYAHATDSSRLTTATSSGLYKVAATAQGHIASLTAVTKDDITGLGIPGSDTNTKYGLSISGHTVSLVEGGTTTSVTVPDNNDNNAVTQTATTTSANYEVLFSSTADNTTRTEGARKNSNLTFNPSTGNLAVTQINGVTVGSSPKFTDNNTTYGLSISGHTVSLVAGGTTSSVTVPDDDTTYESKTAANGGTDLSLVTTGEKYTWNNKLSSHQTIKQDGVTGATVNRYGACDTAAGTAAKTVSVTTGTFSLEAGARVSVKFNNANTAGSPTLNVNSKGAKNIFHKGARITTGDNKALLAGVCDFIYDGTQWHLVGNYIDTDINTTYGLSISDHTVSLVAGGTTSSVTVPDNNTKYGLSISGHTVSLVEGGTTASVTVPDNNDNNAVTQTATSTSADYEVLFSSTADNTTRTEGARKNSNLKFNPSTGNLQVTQINGVTVGSSPKFTDNNTKYGLSISGHTVSLVEGGTTSSVTVPDNNDDNAVTQTATTTSADYEVLFSATADNTTRTEGARKNSNLKFNPSTGNLQVTKINGVDVGSSPKFTDNNTTYGLSISDHTISLVAGGTTSSVTVPDNNTNNAVTQTAASDNNNYRVLLSGTADDTTRTEGAKKDGDFYYNPSTNKLYAGEFTGKVRESTIDWGDKKFTGGFALGDVFINDYLRANRFSGLKAAGVTVEYSTNGGSSWTAYSATDAEKRNLFTTTSYFYVGGSSTATVTANNQLRITVDSANGGIYTALYKLQIYISTNYSNNCKVTIKAALANDVNNYSLTICENMSISGWSGWNVIPCSFVTYGNSSAASSQYRKIQFTFTQTGLSDSTKKGGLIVQRIYAFGGVGWTVPSNMALNGHAYTFDGDMNVTFPAKVSATSFNGYTIAANVPSGAKFTDTTYTANTTSIGSASGWSAGSAPSLSYTSRSIPNVTSVGSKPSLSYTSRSIPNVTGVGSVPSLSYTARSVGSASGWSAGTAASASVANGVLTITNGTAPSLTVTSVACDDITAWDAGSTPTLGTAISADDITAWDAGSTPTLGTAISADDITAWSAGSVPSLTVTSTTVATGITAS